MWSDDYTINPIDILLKHNPDVIVNLSCSPWTWRKNNKRHSVVRERIKNKPTYFAYCNNTGTQNNGKNIFLFDGGSTIYNPDGTFLNVAKNYTEEIITSTLFDNRIMLPNLEITPDQDKKELFEGLVYGIKKFFDTLPSKKVVIGLSGGIDSALDIVLLSEAIGAENVYAINMPSKFNSNTTKDAALQLAINLGVHYGVLSIQNAVDNTIKDIEQLTFYNYVNSDTTGLSLSKLNIENIQARDRGSRVLAGVASALDAVFINNGNKTETAFGYATLYGDVNGSISPIADLYKHEIYELCEYYNKLKKSEIIPSTIFNIVASAELSDEQNVDEGKGDPIFYPYHDKLVRAFVEFRLDPEDILRLYAEKKLGETILCEQSMIDNYFTDETFIADLEQKWKAYKISIFKRIQAPPIIAVSRRAFGFDLREAQNGVYFTREYTNLKNSILKIKI
jgi:NAD+ synthase (glutamine-hydrolysing)